MIEKSSNQQLLLELIQNYSLRNCLITSSSFSQLALDYQGGVDVVFADFWHLRQFQMQSGQNYLVEVSDKVRTVHYFEPVSVNMLFDS